VLYSVLFHPVAGQFTLAMSGEKRKDNMTIVKYELLQNPCLGGDPVDCQSCEMLNFPVPSTSVVGTHVVDINGRPNSPGP
jgi:hypothetical protein